MELEEVLKEHSEELIELILNSSYVQLNASDFYSYACSDSELLDPMDLEWALPIIRKYGYIDGTNAVMASISQLVPIIEHHTEGFNNAMKEIKELNPKIWSR